MGCSSGMAAAHHIYTTHIQHILTEGDGVMNGAGTGISSLSTPLQFIHLLLPTHTHFPLFLFSQLDGDFGDWICFLPQSKVEIRNTFLLQQWIGPGFGMLQISVCHMC
jgi:hypothetical protein